MAVRLKLHRYLLVFIGLASCVVQFGCGETEQIHTYSAPKEVKPVVTAPSPEQNAGEPTDRMLAAILPVGNQAYFFKTVGPIAAVSSHEKELRAFFTSIEIGGDGKPKWQLPCDWKEAPGNEVVMSKIILPSEGKPLEISVTALPWRDDLLGNINRWRSQMHLPSITARQLGEDIEQTKAGDKPITLVDLRGHFGSSGMSPPFAGAAAGKVGPGSSEPSNLPAGHPPLDSNSSNLPPGHPDIGNNGTPPPSAPPTGPPMADVATPKFTPPSDWRALPAGGLRKAAFAVGDEQHRALFTLISFPAVEGPMISDPLQNVNRWRGEVGLEPVKPEELAKVTESIDVDGTSATYVPAIPDAAKSQANTAELAAMIKYGDQMWFLKLKGDRDVVVAQEAAFKNFLKSLRFAGDPGATDGHK
ncbi:MAG TPA: hypothetical protein VH107_17090 [Lacipirellulaceae bacterium]|nr:hypothetical protein [Lacipirellulaceae bacterium]